GPDVRDVVALLRGRERRPARPEARGGAEHRLAVTREPGRVTGGEIVLPLGERDVARDVILVQRVLPGELGRRLLTRLVRLPGVHRAALPVGARVPLRPRE